MMKINTKKLASDIYYAAAKAGGAAAVAVAGIALTKFFSFGVYEGLVLAVTGALAASIIGFQFYKGYIEQDVRPRSNAISDAEFADLESKLTVLEVQYRDFINHPSSASSASERPAPTALEQHALNALKHIDISSVETGINSEIKQLKQTATLNLFLGTIMGVVCLSMLAYTMFAPLFRSGPQDSSVLNSPAFLISKFMFSASFAAFAFFFLAAWRNSINQVRHYRNELTNLFLWNRAFYQDIAGNGGKSSQFVIRQLLAAERNFILKRGETTAEIQLHSIEAKSIQDTLSSISENIKILAQKSKE